MITAERYHDISCGHRVAGHESKCRHLHGHNYRITFTIVANEGLDDIGRVLDFSVIKSKLCMWLEDQWDHKFLAWHADPVMLAIHASMNNGGPDYSEDAADTVNGSIVWTPFNPTAENMAQFLVEVVGPYRLKGTGCTLLRCKVEETRKCSADFSLW